MKDYSKLLTDFYSKYNPDKVSEVNNLLTKYKGQEESLLKKLYEKYKISQETAAEEKPDEGNPADKEIFDSNPVDTNIVNETPAYVMPGKELYQEIKPEEETHAEAIPEKDTTQEFIPQDEIPVELMPEKVIPQEIMPQDEIPVEVMPEKEQVLEIISVEEIAADVLKEEEQLYEIKPEDEIHYKEKPDEELPREKISDTEIPVEGVPVKVQTSELKTEATIPVQVPDEVLKMTGMLDETPEDLRELLTARPSPEKSEVMYKAPPAKSKRRKFLPLIIILAVIISVVLSLIYFLNKPKGGENNIVYGNSSEIQATAAYSDTLAENNPVTVGITDSTGKTGNGNEENVASEKQPQNQVEYVPAENGKNDNSVIHETSKPPADLKDLTIYRVQVFTSKRLRTENQIIIEGMTYDVYQYLYNEIYCYSIGEFSSRLPASEFKNLCRKNGYPDAFVVSIKNNQRIL